MKKLFGRIKDFYQSLDDRFMALRSIRKFIIFSKRLTLPGFDGIPIFDVAVFFVKGIQKGSITNRAAAFSFNLFLAIFPAILFFFSLIPYIPVHNFQDSLLDLLQEFIPQQAYDAVEGTLFDIVKRPRGSLLSFGFIFAMYFATNSINSLIEAFNKSFHTVETRSAFKQRLISIGLVFLLSLLVIVAIILITIGPFILRWLEEHRFINDTFLIITINASKWVITIALLFFAFSFLFYLAPVRKQRFQFISAGSTVTTILFILTSVGFNFYVNNFSRYNSLYGSIGALIIFMLWIYINAIVILLGFELNVSIAAAGKNVPEALKRRKIRNKNNSL
ncbi:MAG: YihY/virulence factor BrkB family protein [Lentimicrobium sp.]|jgi:membrane protein|nr:YihY/virulence factor BrkB family protein [Lentimicrobium sp.]MDD2526740.1 YihY/virulence factor BrkB family protein [Lentimicrobiaceae bacterium]